MTRWLTLALLFISATATADHLVVAVDGPAGQAVASKLIRIQRRSDAGTPLTQGSLTASVQSDSPTGQFNAAAWFLNGWQDGGTWAVGIDNGASGGVFSYRDTVVKTAALTVSAPGYAPVVAPISISPVLIDDDFEGPLLMSETPQGEWPWLQLTPGNTLTLGPLAHRGDGGAVSVDSESNPNDSGGTAWLGFFVDRLTAPVYFRAWVQRRPIVAGSTYLVSLQSNGGPILAIEVGASGAVSWGGAISNGYVWDAGQASVSDGRWTLINARLSGLGTDAGRRDLYVENASVVTQRNLPFTGMHVSSVFFGNAYGNPKTFTGELHFDDVRISTQPLGDTLTVIFNGSTSSLACTPFSVRLLSTIDQIEADAPYDLDVAVQVDGPGEIHTASDCSGAPVSTLRILEGQHKVSGWLSANGALGRTEVQASHPDFLSGARAVNLVPGGDGGWRLPDGGWDAVTPRDLEVRCACASTAPFFSAALLGLMLLRRRPRALSGTSR